MFRCIAPSSGSALFVIARVTVVEIANRCVVMWLHVLVGPCWRVYVALFGSNFYSWHSATYKHQQGPTNIHSHITTHRSAISTTVSLANTSNALPDDGVADCTETWRSCYNVSFNVHFNIAFKTIELCISWWMKKLWYYQDARYVFENYG